MTNFQEAGTARKHTANLLTRGFKPLTQEAKQACC